MSRLKQRMCVSRDLVVFTLLALLSVPWLAQSVAADPASRASKIVFVCEHGSVKSLIAASYFNRSAEARGLPYRAVARGTRPEPVVPAPVREDLRAIGVDVSAYVPKLFQASDLQGASLVVSFDQNIAATVDGKVRQLKWDDLPAVLTDYTRGRDAVVKQVESLIEVLAQGRSP